MATLHLHSAMERLRSMARLPGSADSQPLAYRDRPYLQLPRHIGGDAALRDAAYRAILPEGITYANRYLRRYAFEALVRRAKREESILQEQGHQEKAHRWQRGIVEAEEKYHEEVASRRYVFFRLQERRSAYSLDARSSNVPPSRSVRRAKAEEAVPGAVSSKARGSSAGANVAASSARSGQTSGLSRAAAPTARPERKLRHANVTLASDIAADRVRLAAEEGSDTDSDELMLAVVIAKAMEETWGRPVPVVELTMFMAASAAGAVVAASAASAPAAWPGHTLQHVSATFALDDATGHVRLAA